MAKKNAFLFRFCDPLVADFQAETGKNFVDEFRCVAIRKEKLNGVASVKIKPFTIRYNPPHPREIKIGHDAFQFDLLYRRRRREESLIFLRRN